MSDSRSNSILAELRLAGLGLAGLGLAASAASHPARADTAAERCIAGAAHGDVQSCAAAVESAPAEPSLRRHLAISLTKRADYQGAVLQYREAARLTPGDGRALYEYAWMLAFVRRYAEAVAPIEDAIRLRSDHVPSYQAAAIIYQMLKRWDDAFRVVLAAARLGDSIAMYDVSDCYAKGRGTPADAAQAFHWLLRAAETGHVSAMDEVAEAFLNGGYGQRADDAKAEEWATRARRARRGSL